MWYLGSKEADGVRGSAVVLPVMRQLLRESFRKAPNKATVQVCCTLVFIEKRFCIILDFQQRSEADSNSFDNVKKWKNEDADSENSNSGKLYHI